ncbi:amino acid permease [Luteibacter yeojuensis]|uniref:Arginine/agmatine antiporter n=1 Tax=Luteibacter yeojuensis TaxID=345309 RepID=A0A7X5TQZ9_9GAMM|nr:amino acid permease [Luteibacter yeojuensis]NID16354.1 amino acid permease [Luteibacter yeojuensis]
MSGSRRPLGQWMLISLVIGNIIGSGVFVLPAALAPYGAASLVGWGISLGGALMLALVYARLAELIPDHGGAYAYARTAFGDRVGFVVAWSYWVCVWSANAAIAVAFAGSLGSVWPAATLTPLRGALCALGALWLCTAINLAGVREAGRTAIVLTVLKLLPLVVFGLVGLGWVHREAFEPFNPSGLPLMSVASSVAALTLWAFLGLETATVPTGVVKNPQRTVPRATLAGVTVAGLATMLACTVVIGMLPADVLRTSPAPMVEAATRVWGDAAGIAMGVVATVSCFGALNGWVLLQAQTTLAAAQDGLFPALFARLDRRGTPWFGLLVSSILASVLIGSNYSRTLVALFTFTILLSTAATLVPYLVTVLAWWRIDATARKWRRWIAAGALAFSLWALVGTGAETLMWGAVLLLAGLPVYLWQRRAA